MIGFNDTEDGAGAPIFLPGQIVRHRRYNYRGLVVEADTACLAEEEWYLKNKTQPNRNQPWYHILVDHSPVCTYAAEENLEADDDPSPIRHPLIELFFSAFQDGKYVRNDTPWDGGA